MSQTAEAIIERTGLYLQKLQKEWPEVEFEEAAWLHDWVGTELETKSDPKYFDQLCMQEIKLAIEAITQHYINIINQLIFDKGVNEEREAVENELKQIKQEIVNINKLNDLKNMVNRCKEIKQNLIDKEGKAW